MQRGFTLIELMIVIAIIGILTAVVVPAFKNNKKDGFGNAIEQPAPQRVDTITTCKDGWLFEKEMGGEWRPAKHPTKCQ